MESLATAVAHPKRLKAGPHDQDIKKVEEDVTKMIEQVIPALKNSDKECAHRLLDDNWWITKKCDEIVDLLIKGENSELTQSDAVTTGLYTRYLKRITSHLLNITTGIINPFESLGFREEEDLT